jgi:hypothetical protein
VNLRYALDPAELFRDCIGDPDPWQLNALRSEHPQQLYLCTRQGGKSSVAAIKALYRALFNERELVLMVSKSKEQSQELFHKASLAYQDLGRPLGVVHESLTHLQLGNGSRIKSLSGSAVTSVGYSPHLILVDEAAETSVDLWEYIDASRAATKGDVIALTSAKAASGWFYDLWTRPDVGKYWETYKATADDSSRITDDVLEEQLFTHGPNYVRREFYCEFGVDHAAFFNPEDIARSLRVPDGDVWFPERSLASVSPAAG